MYNWSEAAYKKVLVMKTAHFCYYPSFLLNEVVECPIPKKMFLKANKNCSSSE